MRIPDFSDCGCAARKEIMFTYGQLGIPEAAIMVATILALTLTFRKR